VKVNGYVLANEIRDGAPAPRAWRIATDDGVFWLVEDGTAARLVRLSLPEGVEMLEPPHEDGPWAALAALASSAEAEAGGRWVRRGQPGAPDRRVSNVTDDRP
jgi:hypothetical protein